MRLAEFRSRALEVDIHDDDTSGAADDKLTSLQISPICSDDISSHADERICTAVSNAEVDSDSSCVDQDVSTADDCHLRYDDTNKQFAVVGIDDILVNAGSAVVWRSGLALQPPAAKLPSR